MVINNRKETYMIKQKQEDIKDVIPPVGGSEILLNKLYQYTDIKEYKDINIILSNPYFSNLKYTKKNILWQHLSYSDESNLVGYKDQSFLNMISAFVYVSHWQYEKYRWIYRPPLENSYIIKNAIDPIQFKKKEKNEKIKLIYTSTFYRGLDILLSAFKLLNRDDIELDIYFSSKLYGNAYNKEYEKLHSDLFEEVKNTKNVNYMDFVPNNILRESFQKAHIFAYPSTFEETSCLSMIEAGAAGCRMITTNLGALFETGAEYTRFVTIQSSKDLLIQKYADALNEEINNYWSTQTQSQLEKQSEYYNNFYSWEKRAKEWNTLFDKILTDK